MQEKLDSIPIPTCWTPKCRRNWRTTVSCIPPNRRSAARTTSGMVGVAGEASAIDRGRISRCRVETRQGGSRRRCTKSGLGASRCAKSSLGGSRGRCAEADRGSCCCRRAVAVTNGKGCCGCVVIATAGDGCRHRRSRALCLPGQSYCPLRR